MGGCDAFGALAHCPRPVAAQRKTPAEARARLWGRRYLDAFDIVEIQWRSIATGGAGFMQMP